MSSILDALKKMEKDKAAKVAETETEVEVPFTPESATELFNQPTRHGDAAPKSPVVLITAVAALLVIAVLASALVSMVLMRPQGQVNVAQAPVQIAPLTPPTVPAVQPVVVAPAPVEKPVTIAAAPAPAPIVAPVPAPLVAPAPAPLVAPVPAPVVAPAPTPAPAPAPAPAEVAMVIPAPVATVPTPVPVVAAPVAATPEPEPFRAPTPAPVVSMPPPAPAPRVAAPRPVTVPVPKPKLISAPAPREEPKEVDVATLPMMGQGEFGKYGLDGLALNMLRVPSADRPTGMAIINLNKVYPGELIPGSRARLIGVAPNGIGVEIESSGEQYFIEQ